MKKNANSEKEIRRRIKRAVKKAIEYDNRGRNSTSIWNYAMDLRNNFEILKFEEEFTL